MFKIASSLIGAFVVSTTIAAADPINPDGVWRLTNGRVTVKVTHCGGNNICANIVALAKPLKPDGTPLIDELNPNPALRKRPVLGLPVISGMVQIADNAWKGKIYNADDGGTYRAVATINGNNLNVKGCWLVFCKDSFFVRVK